MKFKEMNRTWKVTSCVVAAALACGSMSAMAYGAGRENRPADTQQVVVEEIFDRVSENPVKANDETVYVIASADGSVEKIIASDWFTQQEGAYAYQMGETEGSLPVEMKITYLLDGREISPQEVAGASGRLTIRFDYENHCRKQAEVGGRQQEMYVPFAALTGMILDSSRVSDVEITNGRLLNDGERIVAVGVALPGLKENIEMEQKPDAEEDSLAQKVKDLEIPQYIEITAQVEDFEMESAYTIVTNELFSGIDTEDLFDMDGLQDQIDELKDAMVQLTDGADRLYDGVATLSDKSGELVNGVNQLYDGSARLTEGAGDLKDGAGTLRDGVGTLQDGVGSLRDGAGSLYAGTGDLLNGLSQLQDNSDALTGGARQVFDTLLATASSQLKSAGIEAGTLTVENYSEVLNNILASLNGGAIRDQISGTASATAQGEVEKAVRAQTEAIRAMVTEGVRANVLEQVIQSVGQISAEQYGQLAGLSDEEFAQLIGAGQLPEGTKELVQGITAAVNGQMESEEVKAQIEAITEQKIQETIAQNMQSGEVQGQIQAGVDSAASGAASQISALKSQLDSYNTFYQGVLSYTSGVSQAASGASQLRDGAGQLVGGVDQLAGGASQLADGASQLAEGTAALESGAKELQDGIGSLKDGSGALVDGVAQLKDGAGELADGLREFDEEGIQKITRLLEEDLKELADRVKATLDLSKEYSSLTESVLAEDESVRFIYKTGAIK